MTESRETRMRNGNAPRNAYDVVVLGGGLAGLTLGIQLKRDRPETSVLIANKRPGPAPEATFKVGESTSEVGAHYFREVVGLDDHLTASHLRKTGLRFFLPAGDNTDIARRVEFATPRHHDIYTFQLDRGRLENELHERNVKLGNDSLRGCRVQDVELGDDGHTVVLSLPDGERSVRARWVVDASGRAALLRRKLDLHREVDHHINAAWFRLDGGMNIETWSTEEAWQNRVSEPGVRRTATTHLAGTGYWVWMIQLASGPISIGVCADPRFHAFEEIGTVEAMLDWFTRHEPQLAAAVEPRRSDILDFLAVKNFSYAPTQVLSTDRWCLTGEAAGFLDPLYSPGSDFIGYGNTFITDLVRRDLDGQDFADHLEFFNFFYFQLFDPTLNLYRDQYPGFGNPQVMVAKLLYDNFAYFGTLAALFLRDRMTDVDFLGGLIPVVQDLITMLDTSGRLFRQWNELDQRQWQDAYVVARRFKPLLERQAELAVPLDDATLAERIGQNVQILKAMLVLWFHRAATLLPEPPDESARIDPLAISLDPGQWKIDRLFSNDGMTLAEARALLPGIEEYLLEEQGASLPASEAVG